MSNKETYRLLCSKVTDLPIFMHDWWLDALEVNWDVAVAMNGDNIAGVWPYATEEKASVTLLRNPVLTPYMGPYVFCPADLKETKRDNFEHETIAALYKQIPGIKVWKQALMPGLKQAGFFNAKGFDVHVKQTFLMPLGEEEVVFQRLHEDYRRNIRKAEAEITISNEPEALVDLFAYQKATLDKKDVSLHYSFAQMQKVMDACLVNNSAALWVARKQDTVQAIVWHVWDSTRSYYLMGSKNPAVKDNRAMTALLWKAISESNKMGKQTFDFEGSMDQGVEKFFRNFGGTRELYLVLSKNESVIWKLKEALRG